MAVRVINSLGIIHWKKKMFLLLNKLQDTTDQEAKFCNNML